MKCIHPITIRNKSTKLDAPSYLEVPCGKCYACLQNKRSERVIRLYNEYLYRPSTYFLTLTINDDNLSEVSQEPKRTIQLFLKRLRKQLKTKLSYFLVSELGTHTNRLHFHALLYLHELTPYNTIYETTLKTWPYGNILIDYCNDARINYVTKYMLKQQNGQTFALMSKNPALGKCTLTDPYKVNYLTQNNTIPLHGYNYPIPRYYKKKLFPDKYFTIEDKFNQDIQIIINSVHNEKEIKLYCENNNLTLEQFYALQKQQYEILKDLKYNNTKRNDIL